MINKLIILVLFVSAVLFAQPQIPNLNMYATDQTGTLSETEIYQLNSALATFEDSTSNQIVLLIIASLDGYPIESYAYDVAVKNKIGSKKNDNGVLFLIVKDDKKMRIEVGYGLEGVLPDALANSIIRNEVAPYFKQNDYKNGVRAGLRSILLATQGEYKGERRRRSADGGSSKSLGSIISFIIFIVIYLLSRIGRGGRGGRGGGIFYVGGFGGSSSGFGSGGGGGFGGFSGGGGGFGGGGSSGGW